jgi:hypothetical protein
MNYRTLGRTGVKVSPLCLGAMMFGAWGNPDHDDSIRIIDRPLDAGINFIDMSKRSVFRSAPGVAALTGSTAGVSRRPIRTSRQPTQSIPPRGSSGHALVATMYTSPISSVSTSRSTHF